MFNIYSRNGVEKQSTFNFRCQRPAAKEKLWHGILITARKELSNETNLAKCVVGEHGEDSKFAKESIFLSVLVSEK